MCPLFGGVRCIEVSVNGGYTVPALRKSSAEYHAEWGVTKFQIQDQRFKIEDPEFKIYTN